MFFLALNDFNFQFFVRVFASHSDLMSMREGFLKLNFEREFVVFQIFSQLSFST